MVRKRTSTATNDQLRLSTINSFDLPGGNTGGEGHSTEGQQSSTEISAGTTTADLLPNGISTAPIESYSADAFTAMTFCFPGFEDDMFGDCVQDEL